MPPAVVAAGIGAAGAIGSGLINKKKGAEAPAGSGDGFLSKYGGDLIGAGTSLLGGYMSSRSSGKATKAQSDANAAALAFERQRYADTKANYEKAMGQYQNQWNAWNQGRMALLQRYGIDVTPFQQAQPQAAMASPMPAPAAPPGAEMRRPPSPVVPGRRASLADLLQ